MLHCQFLCHVLKALFFTIIALKLCYFCKKIKNFRTLGALPPDPQPPAAGGFAPKPPLASGGWGLRPQSPILAPPLRISGYAPGPSRKWTELLHIKTDILKLQFCIHFEKRYI